MRAFNHHECGRKIRRLLSKLSTTEEQEEINSLFIEYDDILDEYENHMSIDYYQFIIENSKKLSPEQKKKIPPWYLVYLWMPVARYIPQLLAYAVTVVLPFKLILQIVSF